MAIATRIIDGLIGIGAGVLSMASAGRFKKLNSIAYSSLQFPGILFDLYFCALKAINPHKRLDP